MAETLDVLSRALADRYIVERELGRGGMATVYLATDLRHERRVAIKVLKPELAAALGNERFLREITTTARLNHPRILPLLDSGNAAGVLYYVMPYVEGESLRDRLDREKQLPIEDALAITRQVAAALSHAHSHDVLHRDVKPENILLSAGEAVVADFGIARAISAAGEERLTQTGLAIGTPAYMSPEQAGGASDLDGRSDIYALGCVLYEMLAGHPPFTGVSPQEVLARHSLDAVPSLDAARPTVSEPLVEAITKALAKVPADRFSTADQFAAALDVGVVVVPRRRIRRRQLVPATLVVGVAAAASAIGVWVATPSEPAATAPVSPSRVAVLPFSVRGSEELAYLADGMVDLLSANLDGAGTLRTVDPQAVLTFVRRDSVTTDPEGGALVAREFGAGLYVVGSVVAGGSQATVGATLYDAEGSALVHAQATLANEEQLHALVDDLTRQLLASGVGGPDTRLGRLAATTTSSVPALREFLRGENAFRDGRLDSAAAAYLRAVAIDSTFALAYARLTMAGGRDQGLRVSTRGTRGRALQYRDKLAERDVVWLLAWEDLGRGAAADAERRLRSLLVTYPSNAEAWDLLSGVLFSSNHLLHPPLTEARAALERAIALDPDNIYFLRALSTMAGIQGKHAESIALLERVLDLAPESDDALVDRAVLAYARGDRAAQERALDELRRADVFRIWYTIMGVAVEAGDRQGAIEVANLLTDPSYSADEQTYGHAMAASLYLGLGQWRAANAQLDRAEGLVVTPRWSALVTRATLAASSFLQLPRAELEELRGRVTALGDQERTDLAAEHYGFDDIPTSAWARVASGYLAGLLSVRLHEYDTALQYAADLAAFAAAPSPGRFAEHMGALSHDLALSVRAHAAWAVGRASEALELRDQMRMGDWAARIGGSAAFSSQIHEHYLKAELLRELGREQEALVYYDRVGRVARDQIYVVPAHFRRAEIYERLGDREAAAYHYQLVMALWEDCDPELRPMVEQARERLTRLETGDGSS